MVSAGVMATWSPPLWWITSQPITASTNQAPKAPARPRYHAFGGPVGGRCGPSWSVQATTSLLDQYSPMASPHSDVAGSSLAPAGVPARHATATWDGFVIRS